MGIRARPARRSAFEPVVPESGTAGTVRGFCDYHPRDLGGIAPIFGAASTKIARALPPDRWTWPTRPSRAARANTALPGLPGQHSPPGQHGPPAPPAPTRPSHGPPAYTA